MTRSGYWLQRECEGLILTGGLRIIRTVARSVLDRKIGRAYNGASKEKENPVKKELEDRVVERANELMHAHEKELVGFGFDEDSVRFYLLNAEAARHLPREIEGVPVKGKITGEIVAG